MQIFLLLLLFVLIPVLILRTFFPEKGHKIGGKILKWTRKIYEENHGKAKTIQDLGEPNEWER